MDRVELITGRQFDLLVIGGGIIGAGIAEAATAHGLDVALVERGDFAGATSSASSKLIHGGLRYLQMGDVRLVREAHQERRALMNIVAPHLVHMMHQVVDQAGLAPGLQQGDHVGEALRVRKRRRHRGRRLGRDSSTARAAASLNRRGSTRVFSSVSSFTKSQTSRLPVPISP